MPSLFQPVSGFSPLNAGRLNLHTPKHVSTLTHTHTPVSTRLYGTNESANTNDGEGRVVKKKEGALLEDSFVAQNFEDNVFDLSFHDGLSNTKDGVHTNEDDVVLGNRVLGPKNVLIYDTSLRGKKKKLTTSSVPSAVCIILLSYRSRHSTCMHHTSYSYSLPNHNWLIPFHAIPSDGTQGESVSVSCDDKIKIASKLSSFNVDYIEAGWPGSNPKDAEFFARAKTELSSLTRSKLVAFGSTRRKGIEAKDDAQIAALVPKDICGK